MSDLGQAIREILLNTTAVSDITTRIYSDHMPQGIQAPAVVFWTIHGDGEDCVDVGPTGFEQSRVQVESLGNNRAEANALWLEVHKALAGYRGTAAGVPIRSVSQDSGHYHREDRPERGGDQYRYVTIQDLLFSFHNYEKV